MHRHLTDFLFDLADNALGSGASDILILIEEDEGRLTLTIEDNGRGMDAAQQARALDPFYTDGLSHPGRRFGLGLPFVVQTLEATGGRFELVSRPGVGTRVRAAFATDHPDTPPGGDWAATLAQLAAAATGQELRFVHRRGPPGLESGYEVRESGLSDALGSLQDVEGRRLARSYFQEAERQMTEERQ